MSGRPSELGRRAALVVRAGRMFVRSGMARPGPPLRVLRQLDALRRWGTLLGGTLVSTAARDPGRIAIIDDEGELTYGEVDARTDRLAAALGRFGAAPRVAVLCRNHRGMVETLVAASKRGSDLVLLNTGMSTGQLVDVVREHEVDVVVADAEFADFLKAVPQGVHAVAAGGPGSELEELIASAPAGKAEPPARPGRTIVLSSGTTGRPKGADRRSRPGLSPMVSILSRIPYRVHERMVIEAPLFHTWGYAMLQAAIPLRATIVLHSRFDPERALRAVAETKATTLVAVPVMLQRILELPESARRKYDTSSLRIAAVSGSALPATLATAFMDAFGDVLYNLYGSTEASWVTIATPADLRARPDTAGTPPPGTKVAILDASGKRLPPGTTGRIFAANELPFTGYTTGDTKETLDGLMSLGDVGHLDEQGRLFVEGRDDDMIVSGGENVFPSAVEEVLDAMPQIREVAVIGVPDEKFGQRTAAYIALHDGQSLDADTVRAHVRDRLARFAVPRDVHFLDELPRNATGKIVRRDLPAGAGESAP
ncbi:acyl-CoA synthetase (AMP-forming)/AMP-acid ligase II [Actinomadura hallensis]|uniref:Acyl-CoA synthetase (AMP-forming)/AMP-acid ligase II n=1 Tax=Actinomadura hallensis TaxID=337895 RepID=A0A543I819_9ACTN|nr:AMP-binding protein [Actinomadura hallensis]TQM66753.1 acyl-CoA synthetase (AMP-forming)/AMP-acid ligase II [Actinomadura hallensis]